MKIFILLLSTVLISSFALAHPGHFEALSQAGFIQGILHPLSGVDHLLAALAVGIWAAQIQSRKTLLPLAFLLGSAVGLLLHGSFGFAHWGSHLSVLFLGLALFRVSAKLPGKGVLTLVSAFGLCHGLEHSELGGLATVYSWGVLLTTAALHLGGMAMVLALRKELGREQTGFVLKNLSAGFVLAAIVMLLQKL